MSTKKWTSVMIALAVVAGCNAGDTAPSVLAPDASTPGISPVSGVTEIVGETGPGSTYALFMPANWNGDLVLYAHGYVQPFLDPGLPDIALLSPVRDHLLTQGYAFAYSSWSETGYAVKDGAQRTHQLNGLFADAFAEPDRTYLWGLSLGGLVAEALSERYPAHYDGTLSTCGVLGGGLWNATYVAHFRVLFDYFYPDVLPGSLYEMPEGYLVIGPDPSIGYAGSQGFHDIYGALVANPFPAIEMAGVREIQLQYHSIDELITGFLHVLGYQVNGANALTERLNGQSFFDNRNVWYAGSADDGTLNAAVARYDADPPGENYFDHWWQPEGDLNTPFVTLHTTRDPLVPFRGDSIFAETVDGAGTSDLLLRRRADAFGHCSFHPTLILDAFGALVQWVETGQKPAA